MHVMHLSQPCHASGSALVTADLPNPLSHRRIPESFPSSQELLAEIAVFLRLPAIYFTMACDAPPLLQHHLALCLLEPYIL